MPNNVRKLKGVLIASVALLIVLCTAIVLFFAFCRADNIDVVGCELYSSEEIIEASGIKEGVFLFSVDRDGAVDSILHKCSVVHDVVISLKLPNKVIISVKEDEPGFKTKIGVSTVMFDCELRVASVNQNSHDGEGVEVLLPEVRTAIGGERIEFASGEYTYVSKILEAVAKSSLFDRVTTIDCTSAIGANCVVDGKFTLIFGGVSDIDLKLEVAAAYLGIERVSSAVSATLDLTSPKEVIVTIND
ncbi:MAG: FtsQ-type POTRA domain-containing protein [Clostridia bacterium]|nr:FtsQ-type POTRA domain-containing protein [Clostridia bacterium]